MSNISISSKFDSGNIEVLKAQSFDDIQVKVEQDSNSDYLQYFFFRVSGIEDQECTIKIMNASETTYPFWNEYYVYASYDKQNWFLVPTEYNGKELVINHTAACNTVYYAYYPPFSYEQHLELIGECQTSGLCSSEVLGQTVEGRDIDFLQIGFPSKSKKKIWVIARQHPGESMAEWFMQGFLRRLLDEDDSVSKALLNKAVFYIVPNMNIDGSILGNLRANAAGANLNREWADPSLEKSPEVFHVRNAMDELGVDFCLDVHGDEEIPYNFISASEGAPSYNDKIAANEKSFIQSWIDTCPDFQDTHGYDKDEPGKADLRICTPQITERYKALCLTIEMPFKNNHDLPDPLFGWSTTRSEKLGASVLQPTLAIIDKL